jgi:nitrogen-specific signal transduction histidine kinase/CheY-like chemotaxis protein
VRIFRPQPKKLAILFNDITEQQKAEELLRQRQKMESLGILAGGIAHDFNNLLQAMLGQLSIAMTKMETSNPAYSNIEKGQKAAIRAAELTQQLLAYSGRGKFQIVPINLTELIRENMHLFEVSIPKNVVIRTNFDSTLIVINGDPGQIQQIIMNLIINAGEAIGLRQGEIQISTRRKRISESETQDWDKALEPPRPGEYAIIEVKDNGCGMNDETLSRIFDPFFTTKFTGRGLGLAAVLGIIRGHKGGMLVESKVYKGTTFRIALPLAETELQENGEEKISGNLFDGAVLIIDDEDFVREFVTDVLEMESIKAISAGSGEEGVKIYRNHCTEIKVVLLDLSMPGMGGKETFEELKKINSQVKVVLSSGYSETEATSRFTRDGLVGFIQKPYKPDTLLKILQKLI